MNTCGALLVLLGCCLAETRGETISENDITHQEHYGETKTRENAVMGEAQRTDVGATTCIQETCLTDIHTVLREMSTMIGEHRVELGYIKTQMEAIENKLKACEIKGEAMENRLSACEIKGEAMENRLSACEIKVAAIDTRLRASESLVEQLKRENEAQAVKLNLTVHQVEELRREREESKVSFSTSLLASGSGNIGPFSVATPLVYRHVFTNIGNAYNPHTGVFTAPVRGVYHFVLFLFGFGHTSTNTEVSLHKNGEHVVIVYSHHPNGDATPSNGASLLLEVGDVVYVKLWPNAWAHDSGNHHTTFSGHLLFAM